MTEEFVRLAAACGLKAAPIDERSLGVLPGVDRKNPAPDESEGRRNSAGAGRYRSAYREPRSAERLFQQCTRAAIFLSSPSRRPLMPALLWLTLRRSARRSLEINAQFARFESSGRQAVSNG
jgi:hypothetical protein